MLFTVFHMILTYNLLPASHKSYKTGDPKSYPTICLLLVKLRNPLQIISSYFDISLYFHRRNLEYFDACHFEGVASCDMEWSLGNGELIIKVPKEVYDSTPGKDVCVYVHACRGVGSS